MKKLLRLIPLALLMLLTACGNAADDGKLKVVSTIGMINDIVLNVGKEYVSAEGLMGPGVDPHLYNASEGDVRKLAAADVILYNGLHLEAKMGDVLAKMAAKKPVIAVADEINKSKLRPSEDYANQYDPHVWFDVSLWETVVDEVAKALAAADPDHAEAYRLNAGRYKVELKILNRWVTKTINKIPEGQRVLITAHDAFGYFGQAYGVEVMGLQGLSTVAEAGTKDVQDLASTIVSRKINAIFVESSVPERHIKAVQAAAKAKGWNVQIGGELFADAMGDYGTPEGSYIGMVQHNVGTIVKALTGKDHDH